MVKPLILFMVVLVSVISTAAQGSFPYSLSLDAAVEKALVNNPQTRISESGVRTADLDIAESRTGKRPSLYFSESVVRSNNPVFVFGSLLEQGRFAASNFALNSLNNPSALTNFRSSISGQLPLFDRHQTGSKIAVAEISKKQADLQAEAVRQQLRFDVIKTYFGAVLGQEKLRVNEEAVRSAASNCKKTGDMADVGMTTEADYLAAEVELANAGQQKMDAEGELTITRAALGLLLGHGPDLDVYLTGDLQERYFRMDDQDALIRTALANRPDYISAALAIDKNKRRSKAEKDLSLPRIDAFGNFGHSSPYITNGSTDYTVGVSLTYTLFDAGRKARRAQAAEAEILAEAQKDALANQIILEVVRGSQTYRTAHEKIKVSIKSIAQASESLSIIQDRYKFGLATFNDVIQSEAALVRAKHNLLSARYEYYVAYASVLLATGQLTDVKAF